MRVRISSGGPRNFLQFSPATTRQFLTTILIPVSIVLGLALWVSWHPLLSPAASPSGGMFTLIVIAVGLAFAIRFLRWRLHLDPQTTLALPDPLYALYLATLILIGPRNAVLLAIMIPLIACLPDILEGMQALRDALRQATAASITMFGAGLFYFWAAQTLTPHVSALQAHIVAAVIASVFTCIGAATIQFVQIELAQQQSGWPNKKAVLNYLASPSLRFQALLLSVGPLLPLAELLDDIEAEFAWLLFLIPLFAVYYLALMSIRLEQRTSELQQTVIELGAARRREIELTDYAALITRAQEDERRRLARELHDDTAQALIALSRGLDALATRPVEPPLSSHDKRFTEDLGDLSKRTLESVRRACQDLRPSVLDDLGLSAALESLAHSESKRGPECTFHQYGEGPSYVPEMEVTIYRIAQESLANARQHGQATKTTLDVRYEPNRIALRVTDNGIGFNPQKVLAHLSISASDDEEQRPGLGLLGMRERAALIHAHLTITSVPKSGTVVALDVPLSER